MDPIDELKNKIMDFLIIEKPTNYAMQELRDEEPSDFLDFGGRVRDLLVEFFEG